MSGLERIVRFKAGHDCTRFECRWGKPICIPGTGGSHGASGMEVSFIVKGDEGAVQFVLLTGWLPQHVTRDQRFPLSVDRWGAKDMPDGFYPIPSDLGYHSKVPRHKGDKPISDKCEFTGGPCYYDSSGPRAAEAMYALVNGGDKALWEFMEAFYDHVFNGGQFPTSPEYPTKPRNKKNVELSEENIAENAPKHDIANDNLFDFAAQLVRAIEDERNLIKGGEHDW